MSTRRHLAWLGFCIFLSVLGLESLGLFGALLLAPTLLGINIFCDYEMSESSWVIAIYYGRSWPLILYFSLYAFRFFEFQEKRPRMLRAKKIALYISLLYVPSVVLALWYMGRYTAGRLSCG